MNFINLFFYVVLQCLRVLIFLRSIGTLNTLNFLHSNTMQLSKSPNIYTTQYVSVYATAYVWILVTYIFV